MAKKTSKTKTTVKEHLRHVPVSSKNPAGVTTVDEHTRRLKGTFLDRDEIESTVKNYNKKFIAYPTSGELKEFKNADAYDELIAIWTDYFNQKFKLVPKIDPNVIKALIASESGFDEAPKGNSIAFGITQITKETLRILQDPKGEAREFIFNNIRQKDLNDPRIAIPMAIRWLARKQQTAAAKLKHAPTSEEVILEGTDLFLVEI